MRFRRTSLLYLLTGLLALFALDGDIVADALADLRGEHCFSQSSHSDSQHEKSPCSHCSCAVHNGTVVASNSSIQVGHGLAVCFFVTSDDQPALASLPVAIDHPPQLA